MAPCDVGRVRHSTIDDAGPGRTIVKIAKLEVVPAQKLVQADVLKVLGHAIELAEAGELQCVALAGVRSDGHIFTNISLSRSRFEMLGAVTMLQSDIIKDVNEG